MSYSIKQNDHRPVFRATLSLNGSPFNLTGVVAVRLHYRYQRQAAQTRTMVVVDALLGVVQYDWETGDLPSPGVVEAEVQVEYEAGRYLTFPNGGALSFNVTPEIA